MAHALAREHKLQAWIEDGSIVAHLDASDAGQVIDQLALYLIQHNGAVRDTFAAAVRAREMEHPTGLPTEPWPVAIPHTDADQVIRPAIAVATLARPVQFFEMGNPNTALDVRMVFLLAIADSVDQITCLQSLITLIQRPDFLVQAVQATTSLDLRHLLLEALQSVSDSEME